MTTITGTLQCLRCGTIADATEMSHSGAQFTIIGHNCPKLPKLDAGDQGSSVGHNHAKVGALPTPATKLEGLRDRSLENIYARSARK